MNGKETVAGLKIEGDRHGVVTVRSPAGERLHEFRMGPGVVRETYLLERGQVHLSPVRRIGRCSGILRTGKEVRSLDRRIYGFSPS